MEGVAVILMALPFLLVSYNIKNHPLTDKEKCEIPGKISLRVEACGKVANDQQ